MSNYFAGWVVSLCIILLQKCEIADLQAIRNAAFALEESEAQVEEHNTYISETKQRISRAELPTKEAEAGIEERKIHIEQAKHRARKSKQMVKELMNPSKREIESTESHEDLNDDIQTDTISERERAARTEMFERAKSMQNAPIFEKITHLEYKSWIQGKEDEIQQLRNVEQVCKDRQMQNTGINTMKPPVVPKSRPIWIWEGTERSLQTPLSPPGTRFSTSGLTGRMNYEPSNYRWIQESLRLRSRTPRLMYSDRTDDGKMPEDVVKGLWALM